MHPGPRPPHLQPRALALVATGGVLGTLARYAVARLLPTPAGGLPVATLATNLVGAFLLGLLLELLGQAGADAGRARQARLLLGTGLLGAFTTWSTLAVEVVLLGRDGRPGLGLTYGVVSVLSGLAAAAAGVLVAVRLRRS